MARGRSRYQRGRVVSTTTGGWEIHYNVYLTDPATGKPKRHHRSRVVEAVRRAIDEWGRECATTEENALMFSAIGARGRKPLDKPMLPDNWLRLRLYPVANKLGIAFHPTFQVLRRSFSTHGKKEAHPTEMQAQLTHSDIRTTLDIYTQITDPEVSRMVNQVTNRILGLGEEVEPGSVQ